MDFISYILVFCAIGGLTCGVLAAYSKYSPKRIKKENELKENYEILKSKLNELTMRQINSLNNLYRLGTINYQEYIYRKQGIINGLKEVNVDPGFIDNIPEPTPINKSAMLDGVLDLSSQLNGMGKMDDEKFNKYINLALDEKKKLK